ncbi:MAG: hypothetical protein Kow0019_13640 [Methanobacteriaceae archaeon]
MGLICLTPINAAKKIDSGSRKTYVEIFDQYAHITWSAYAIKNKQIYVKQDIKFKEYPFNLFNSKAKLYLKKVSRTKLRSTYIIYNQGKVQKQVTYTKYRGTAKCYYWKKVRPRFY